MEQYLQLDEWSIIEEGFHPNHHELSESIFSIGNGYMGQRANFEERYSGSSLQGSYMAGVYYPDKTRVGWWKNGYPEYFAKVLNSTNWIGIDVNIDDQTLDLATCKILSFRRELNMKAGYLLRECTVELPNFKQVRIKSTRFVSLKRRQIGAIKYQITPLNFSGKLALTSYLDGDVSNKDANYDEKFWVEVNKQTAANCSYLTIKTKKLDFHLTSAMHTKLFHNDVQLKHPLPSEQIEKDKYVGVRSEITTQQGETVTLYKYVANVTSRDYEPSQLINQALHFVNEAIQIGFEALLEEQKQAWGEHWKECDIVIAGDLAAQQAIRFNIFQLYQTYTGEDNRLNIGPKGFTGEKYGGSTYWDTEAYCLPFYLSTADEHVARNLLIYRHNHLEKAKENARKLEFSKGALYPMVTMNGEECHNEWEITFEEIHRNGAIAYAIYNYVNYTGDEAYLYQYGLDVLIEISRFWEERVQFSKVKQRYVMLGVTGPNEYENNVNNNWYTNRIATWTLEYTLRSLEMFRQSHAADYDLLVNKLAIQQEELKQWQHIIDHMYYPVDEEQGIFLQQDGFLDKEIVPVKELSPAHLPINQHWSWDRILRSCYIKQADVLQGLYFLGHLYDIEIKKRNFDFYEPITVHESSLSPCVHSILACELGYVDKAYEMYLRTSRLDLDNYNNDTEDGCHITSMAGTWMSITQGFGGMKVQKDMLCLAPIIPHSWTAFSFKIMFRHARLQVHVSQEKVIITHEAGPEITVRLYEDVHTFAAQQVIEQPLPTTK
ncbi:glycoside hydrolase family 65 protein [Paenibacillus turicensis]|uniref:glycoside hydrolase family 65 protein n=1 Tax=Paenibacillus turicensis TaxID=160487 RepID=UPI003D278680